MTIGMALCTVCCIVLDIHACPIVPPRPKRAVSDRSGGWGGSELGVSDGDTTAIQRKDVIIGLQHP